MVTYGIKVSFDGICLAARGLMTVCILGYLSGMGIGTILAENIGKFNKVTIETGGFQLFSRKKPPVFE